MIIIDRVFPWRNVSHEHRHRPLILDIISLVVSAGLFTAYHLFAMWKLKTNPIYTIYGATKMAKTAWVVKIMEEKNDILAIQTLRNSTMAATFLASTSILLAVGLLTLSGQGRNWGIPGTR